MDHRSLSLHIGSGRSQSVLAVLWSTRGAVCDRDNGLRALHAAAAAAAAAVLPTTIDVASAADAAGVLQTADDAGAHCHGVRGACLELHSIM